MPFLIYYLRLHRGSWDYIAEQVFARYEAIHRGACKKEETTRTHVESLMCKVQSSLKGKNQMWSEREGGVCQKRKKTVSPWPPVDLYLISEKSIWKNQVRQTGFLAYFKLDFYCLDFCRLKSQFVELDFSNLIFQKSSTDQQGVRGLVLYERPF